MEVDQLFQPGAEWKHREREFLVFIRTVIPPDKFTLAFIDKSEVFEASWEGAHILQGMWTAEELIRDFDPMPVRATRYDLIHDGLFDDEG